MSILLNKLMHKTNCFRKQFLILQLGKKAEKVILRSETHFFRKSLFVKFCVPTTHMTAAASMLKIKKTSYLTFPDIETA